MLVHIRGLSENRRYLLAQRVCSWIFEIVVVNSYSVRRSDFCFSPAYMGPFIDRISHGSGDSRKCAGICGVTVYCR